MSDRPGRSFSSTSRHRSSMEYGSDPVKDRHRDFARHLVEQLARHRVGDAFDRLIIAAEPRMLGYIREFLDPRLAAVVADEIPKDFVKLPHARLVEAITASTSIVP